MNNKGPLSGLLVLDLTRVLVGPYCTMILSDLGARVIKVEAPGVGDDSRGFGPFVEDQSAYFMSLNRNKESIALNLKVDEDKKIFEKTKHLIYNALFALLTKDSAGYLHLLSKLIKNKTFEKLKKGNFDPLITSDKKNQIKKIKQRI